MTITPPLIYQLKITLSDIRPSVWRRVLVPDTTRLRTLHQIIQLIMGWTDSHLHLFRVSDKQYSDADLDPPCKSEAAKLSSLGLSEKFKFEYEYDFGDFWIHAILIEKISTKDPEVDYPTCIAGKRACPLDDSGGACAYMELLDVLSDSTHDDHDEMLEWAAEGFDSEAFSVSDVNKQLQRLRGNARKDL